LTSTSVASSSAKTAHSRSAGQPARQHDLGGLRLVHPGQRVHHHLRDRGGAGARHLFDLHTALHRADRGKGARGPVHQEGQVELPGDVTGFFDEDRAHPVAFDIHAEDFLRPGLRLVRALGQLDAARLAPPAGLHLGLHHHA